MTKLKKDAVEDLVALTPTQEGMLLAYMKDPTSLEYVVQSTVTIEGDLTPELFRRTWQFLVDRHQALRSTFRWESVSQPTQVVLKTSAVEASYVDLVAERRTFDDVKARDRARGHDLEAVPFRAVLVRLGEGRHRMLLSYHHIILDGWSLGLLASEFTQAYRCFARGEEPALPPPTPVNRYVAWRAGQSLEASRAWWQSHFAGYEGAHALSLKHARLESRTPADLNQTLDAALEARLRAFATKHGLTPATVVYAAFALLLSAYGRTKDVVFGTTVSGRAVPVDGIERGVGNFIGTVPLRVTIDGGSAARFCSRVAASLNDRREHETASLVDLRRFLGTQEEPFDTIVVVENYPFDLEAEGIRLSGLESDEPTSYELTVSVTVHEALAVQWSYRAGRLLAADVERLSRRFASLLEQLVADGDRDVRDFDLFLGDEEATVLERFARGPVDADVPSTFVNDFARVVAEMPERPALVFGERVTTFAELDERARSLAGHLRELGVERETPVALLLDRSDELVVALLAVLLAGGAFVPLSPQTPVKRLEHLVRESEAALVLVHASTAERAPAGARVVDVSSVPAPGARGRALPALDGEQLAYVIYTSGSTGEPKGVAVEHRALTSTIAGCARVYPFGPGTRSLLMFDATADTSLEDVFCTLTRGGTLHVAPRELIFDRERFCSYVRDEGITLINYLPSVLRELLPEEERLASLECLIFGSEPLAEDVKDHYLGLGYAVFNGYGTTEAAIETTNQRCAIDKRVTLGRPVANAGCAVLDDRGRPCPIGVPGELVLLGRALGRGYWRRDDLTARAYVSCAALGGERVYRTGDLAAWQEDGELRFLGRIDRQLKVNGFRVEPHEIERTIASHDKVKDAAVAAHALDGGGTFVSAFVVCATSTDLETKNLLGKGLRTYLAERLPEHMVPNRFFPVPELPRLPNGKVDLEQLRAAVVEAEAQDYVPPADDIEAKVAAVWGSVLGRSRVSTTTPFRELGGDSLMLIRIYAGLNKAFPGVLKVQDLFDHRTVQELGGVIRERTTPAAAEDLNVLDF